MGFSNKQINALRRNLDEACVRKRQVQGRELSYIEGWHAIAEANRIFGFDGWDRETVESKCVLAREVRGTLHAVYVAKVRITVRAETEAVVREGYGTGESHGQSAGEAHERALKTAETDATKRALATFGKPFGLSLYLSARAGRDHRSGYDPNAATPIPDHERRRTLQRLGANGRYYVPPHATRVIDPVLAPARAGTESGAGPAQIQKPLEPVPANETSADGTSGGAASHQETPDSNQTPDSGIASGVPPLQPQLEITTPDTQPEHARLLIDWPKRRRDPAHLRFVAAQPCLLCSRAPSDPHHLRFAQPRALGRKVSDEFTVPLCRTHHRQLHHSGNEVEWWKAMDRDVDPLEIAKGLWEQSHSPQRADAPARDLPPK